ncbi:MAG TPA: DUF5069 domain-containing protein [Candidatus Didemnitutus sp.]|nr:DUF5069 domain-containing protein [Candidatus Didemnitutus sp.]
MAKSLKSSYTNPSATGAGAVNLGAPDLTKFPPRSPRVRLGGFVHFPRLIDKARAHVAGTNGDYHYDCPVDSHFWAFTGIKASEFIKEVKAGKSDSDLLAYVLTNAKPKRTPSEIAAWSAWYENRPPGAADGRAFFTEVHRKNAPHRDDIGTWFDWLDLDDYVTFGGKA